MAHIPKNKKCALVTGASGFVGGFVVPFLKENYEVKTISLQRTGVEALDLAKDEVIVHLAGIAHQMTKIDDSIYFQVNRDLTLKLAEKAKLQGVRQFIFISTVKVYGDTNETYLTEKSICTPTDPYGQSKWEAEQALMALHSEDFKVAIIRPPLVYGKGVKGNLERIISLIKKLPVVPFDNIENQRSMVYVGNLAALIAQVIEKQASGVFIAGDIVPASTTQLVKAIYNCLGLKKPMLSIPVFLRLLLKAGKPELYARLYQSYVIDNTATNRSLEFVPPFSFEAGVREMVNGEW